MAAGAGAGAGARVGAGSAAAGEVAVAPAEEPVGAGAAAVVPVAFGAVAPLSTPPCPLHAPFPPWLFVPSLHVTSAALEVAPAAVGAAALDAEPDVLFDFEEDPLLLVELAASVVASPVVDFGAVALFSTPPCPLQAPFPAWLFVPSLQVTSAASAAPAGAAALDSELDLLFDFDDDPLLLVELAASVVASPAVDFGAVALLSTPPCPLQAPFPAWLFVPSLQVTSAASCGPCQTRHDQGEGGEHEIPATPPAQVRVPLESLDISNASAPAPIAFTSCGFLA